MRTEALDAATVIGLEPGQQEYRTLIVEDHREDWLLLQRQLERVGFQLRVAEDVRVSFGTGLDATKRIHEVKGRREVSIVALTASAFTTQGQRVRAASFDRSSLQSNTARIA